MNTHTPRLILGALACLMTLGSFTADASALDGYQDRKGLFVGVGLGGGVSLVEADPEGDVTGIDQGRKVGMHLHGILGGGASDNLVFGAEGNLWARTVYIEGQEDRTLEHYHMSFGGVLDYFLFENFYVEGGVGLAYGIFDVERNQDTEFLYQELGLSAKFGGGFEFFVDSNIALGMRANYTRHFYSNSSFDTLSAGITLRWY